MCRWWEGFSRRTEHSVMYSVLYICEYTISCINMVNT